MKGKLAKRDWSVIGVVLLTSLFGVVAVFSASRYVAGEDYGNEFYYALKQLLGFVGGAAAMTVTSLVDYKKYEKPSIILFAAGLLMLCLVFVPGLGVKVYGAARWINLGLFTVQPSEFARIFLVLFVAAYFAKNPARAKTFKGISVPLGAGILTALLVIIEPNMSVTICVVSTLFVLLFAAGTKKRHFAMLLLPAVALVPLLIAAEPYRLKRLAAFLDPWANPRGEGYQLIQSLYGLGSGGFFGVGLFNSRQKYRFLPFSESDFILSVIGEETGFVGITLLFFASFWLVLYGIRTAKRANDFFGYLTAVGITASYGIQVLINALVVTGSIPPTGIPLPLVSSGNTSLVVNMAAFGVLVNISKQSRVPVTALG